MSDKDFYIQLCSGRQVYVPIFMQPWWLDATCSNWDVVIARKGDHIAGAWAYPVEKKMGVSLLRNPAMTPYLGPQVFYPEGMKESSKDSFEHETITELVKQLPLARVWQLALQPGMKQAGIFRSMGLHPQVQQTFLLELYGDEPVLFANIKEGVRRNIQAVEKELVISNSVDSLDVLYRLQQKSARTVPSLRVLSGIMDACIANNATALWVAKKQDSVQAVVWQVWDEQRSYFLAGAQAEGHTNDHALSALLWHTIKDAKSRGNELLDMEGGLHIGVEKFFRSFGGERALYMVLHKNDSLLWKIGNVVKNSW